MKTTLAWLSLAFFLAAPDRARAAESQEKLFGKDPVSGLGYLLYLPKDVATAKEKPALVIFLHGSGERGSDLKLLHKNNLPKRLDAMADVPYVAVAPQCPAGKRWDDVDQLDQFLDHLLATLPVDRDRVVLTGLSLGGMGTWKWGAARPRRFAALAPVCGAGDVATVGALKGMPIWAFHGDKDKAVPYERGKAMADAAQKAGADVKFTTYPGVGHDSWVQAYAEPEFDKWVLSRRK